MDELLGSLIKLVILGVCVLAAYIIRKISARKSAGKGRRKGDFVELALSLCEEENHAYKVVNYVDGTRSIVFAIDGDTFEVYPDGNGAYCIKHVHSFTFDDAQLASRAVHEMAVRHSDCEFDMEEGAKGLVFINISCEIETDPSVKDAQYYINGYIDDVLLPMRKELVNIYYEIKNNGEPTILASMADETDKPTREESPSAASDKPDGFDNEENYWEHRKEVVGKDMVDKMNPTEKQRSYEAFKNAKFVKLVRAVFGALVIVLMLCFFVPMFFVNLYEHDVYFGITFCALMLYCVFFIYYVRKVYPRPQRRGHYDSDMDFIFEQELAEEEREKGRLRVWLENLGLRTLVLWLVYVVVVIAFAVYINIKNESMEADMSSGSDPALDVDTVPIIQLDLDDDSEMIDAAPQYLDTVTY